MESLSARVGPGHGAAIRRVRSIGRTGVAVGLSSALVLIGQAALPTSGQAAAAAKTASHSSSRDTAATNKALVLKFNEVLFDNPGLDPAQIPGIVAQYTTTSYKEHNPTVADGQAGLIGLVTFLHKVIPTSRMYVQRAIAQGNLVLLQSHAVPVPGAPGQSIIDIFRVDHGLIAEHWDNIENVPAATANGHDLFSTQSSPQTSDPDPSVSTAGSELVVAAYLYDLVHHGLSAVDRFVAPNVYQHDPLIADGTAALKAYYTGVYAASPKAIITVARVVAEGDLVAVHYHFQKDPSDLGQSVVDIYRVRNHKIVEHWDGVQDVLDPAKALNGNGMF